ncbi:TNF receptor-associated factor 3-like [Paramuricea clavata]|uniref:TNF receptor-associated factor 3-like n=1 Tax=Paramuricea clavata TaxID=317549 RepID=A0A6S7IPG4_PARCT|nr:TNF receptor-associated factor 3-like [Paramuricea clavata]
MVSIQQLDEGLLQVLNGLICLDVTLVAAVLFVVAFFTVLIIIACNIVGLETLVANVYRRSSGEDVENVMMAVNDQREVRELKEQVSELTTACGNLQRRHVILEKEVKDKISIIDRLQSRMDQMDESLAKQTRRIADLEFPRGPPAHEIHNGILLWKIEDYEKKRQDAIHGVKTTLSSRPFYTDLRGYKMCAVIYLNGYGSGKGSHLSLFFVVIRGDNDALLTWPFQKKITMMLLDQGNGDHMIDVFHSDPQSSSFQRPELDMNVPSGFPEFVPLESLNNRQYIKDDVMFIKIIVD